MAAIRLQHLVKRYDNGFQAVRDVSLQVEDGEFLVLVGPSGCGKSTTLRMIAGLESISEGDLFIAERRVNHMPPGKRDIAMVFQNYALYPHMTVRQNMSFGLKMRRLPRTEIQERVAHVAAILSIEPLLDRRPRELSGGQRQRVAVGRAIVRQPAAFLLDEPLSNLDAKLRVQMRKELAQLHDQLQTTTIYVTHDQVEAMTLGQRIVVMHEGQIQQVATPLLLYEQPSNQFVASFIGSPAMNLVPGKLVRDSARPTFQNNVIRYPIPAAALPPHSETGQPTEPAGLVLGFRPEHLTFSDQHPALASVRVDRVERLGDETMLYFEIQGQTCVARLTGDTPWQRGESVTLHLPADRWYLFHPGPTGQLICRGMAQPPRERT